MIQRNLAVNLVIIPAAHGYRDQVSNEPDERTQIVFRRAADYLRTSKAQYGHQQGVVKFAIIKSVARNTIDGPLWWEIQHNLALAYEVPEADIIVLDMETWNGTLDTVAIGKLALQFPNVTLRIYPWAGGVVRWYFERAFSATSRHILKLPELKLQFTTTVLGQTTFGTNLQYLILGMITLITGLNKWTYRAWYHFFNWLTSGRTKAFTGTARFRNT